VVAKKILADSTMLDEAPMGPNPINARIVELGGVANDAEEGISKDCMLALDQAMKEGDSLGAIVECVVPEIDFGYGEPFWDSVELVISHAIFSIPGVRAIEFGDGFEAARMKGSEHNDPIGPECLPVKNGAGGVNGGITNGAPVKFRVAFKPTSSISKPQHTFNFAKGEMDILQVPGRHDACFALRAPVVVEAMTAIALADLVILKN
jgi:chorismate synthase